MKVPQRCPLPRLLPPVLLLLAAGCGGAGKPVKVEGVVTLDGKPLPGATVTFAPVGQGPVASGQTEPDGSFRLTTFNTNDGALPGEYKVIVVLDEKSEEQFVGMDPNAFSNEEKLRTRMTMSPKGKKAAVEKKKKSPVPATYSDMNKTPLRERVPHPEGRVTLALRSGGP